MIRRPLRAAALVSALTLVAAACTIEIGTPRRSPSTVSTPDPSPSPVPTGKGSAAAAMAALCDVPAPPERGEPKPPGEVPADIAEVEAQVERTRGLDFERPVAIEPVTDEQIERRLLANFEDTVPKELNARRSLAWQTIGVIPAGTQITAALRSFLSGQVVGFYDPAKQALVYIGQDELTTTSRYILAHELTHAVDDQHFDLTRLDPLAAGCDDEAFMAGLGAVEGSAQFTATEVILRFQEPDEEFGEIGGGSTEGVPPFIVRTQLWPYEDGMRFIDQLDRRGGEDEVDAALARFPVSTEQVIHPDRYPNDTPQPVNVPDLARRLPGTWKDLDVMVVGEAWLRIMLELRIDAEIADRAAAGWDGGLYRAWIDGDRVAVVLKTVWDTADDARAFAEALRGWIGGGPGFVADPRGRVVVAGFASDRELLEALSNASAT
ncbi:MAG: hypothetical protein U0V56_12720 [Actinomycetota bacterium]